VLQVQELDVSHNHKSTPDDAQIFDVTNNQLSQALPALWLFALVA
jgi:hypothetical protein